MVKIFWSILVFLFSFQMHGAAVASSGVWFQTSGKVKAVALLTQGLNFKAEKMNALAESLQKMNIQAYRMTLTGLKGDDMDDLVNVNAEIWRQDFRQGYAEAAQKAKALNVPIYFVGFSLGALVGLDEMARENSNVRFDRMALFAPALALKPVTKLLGVLKLLGKGFCIPSRNLPDYRVHPCTPLGAYTALLSTLDDFQSQKTSVENVPTLIFIDPDDELVSLSGLKKLVTKRSLTNWSFFEVDEGETLLPERIHHLIIDERGVGLAQWIKVTGMLQTHFQ